jgi:hypothetical protein
MVRFYVILLSIFRKTNSLFLFCKFFRTLSVFFFISPVFPPSRGRQKPTTGKPAKPMPCLSKYSFPSPAFAFIQICHVSPVFSICAYAGEGKAQGKFVLDVLLGRIAAKDNLFCSMA